MTSVPNPRVPVLRLATVVDEFTASGLEPEGPMLKLLPEAAQDQIDHFCPDILFVESAWHGSDGAWTGRILRPDEALRDLIAACRRRHIPTVFWSKEDPVHFSAFLAAAQLFDHVFTTDIDCIPAYRRALGHDRVHLLPFAVQPLRFTPVETLPRKRGACFAGTYYRQFPERQRAFADLVDGVEALMPVDIYDRRHGDGLDHYTYPQRFQPLIRGSLPFDRIDLAYKGYRFGLNVNTITQSQTMLSRRALELMASNTVVISNPARGQSVLLGGLVIAEDSSEALKEVLAPLLSDNLVWQSHRLQALRHVLLNHTWADRLARIVAATGLSVPMRPGAARIALVAQAWDAASLDRILTAYAAQGFSRRHLFLQCPSEVMQQEHAPSRVSFHDSAEDLISAALGQRDSFDLWGEVFAGDAYGPDYLTDLALATLYAPDAAGFAKSGDGVAYRPRETAAMRAALVRNRCVDAPLLRALLARPGQVDCPVKDGLLALDPFNHGRNGAMLNAGPTLAHGVRVDRLCAYAERLPRSDPRPLPAMKGAKVLTAVDFDAESRLQKTMPVDKRLEGDELVVTSKARGGKPVYLWQAKPSPRESFGLHLHSSLRCALTHDLDKVQLAIEFYDAQGQSLGRQMLRGDHLQSFPIPDSCTALRFGLRMYGTGEVRFRAIRFGPESWMPALVVAMSDRVVITAQESAHDSRFQKWFCAIAPNKRPDVLVVTSCSERTFTRAGRVDIAQVDLDLLQATLESGQYSSVILHGPTPEALTIVERSAPGLKIASWKPGLVV